ncbi:unnamed protein product [Cunninghamella blakesleeana]
MANKPVILITGASKGIGRAMVMIALKKFDANVVAVARSKELLETLKAEATEINKQDSIEIVDGDVCDEHVSRRAVNVAIDKWGRLNSVIANAGVIEPFATVAESAVQGWKRLFDINFFSIITLVQESLPHLRHSKGSIILISSGAALGAYRSWGAYGSSKAALNHLGMTLGVEEPDVTTISLRPGVVGTGMQKDIREKGGEAMGNDHNKFMELHRSGKLLAPETPGHVAVALGLNPPRERSGGFYSWDDELLKEYRNNDQ